jgi:transcriptional regulator with XRE-family HTH domain
MGYTLGMVFPQRLKRERQRKGWSQATLAAKLGVTREYLARLEGGLHDPPLSSVGRLAKILRISIVKLVK